MEWLASLFFKVGLGALGDAFFKPFLAHLDTAAKIDADKFKEATGAERDVIIAQTQASASAYHEQMQLNALRWGWWGFRWLLVAAGAIVEILPPLLDLISAPDMADTIRGVIPQSWLGAYTIGIGLLTFGARMRSLRSSASPSS